MSASPKSPKRRASALADKFLKWQGGKKGSQPRRHLSSADGHARRSRMARALRDHPQLVEQLRKDIKKEMQTGGGSSASAVSRMRNVEQMQRMMGAMAARSYLVRAMFKQKARAFYHWLCDGVDHGHVAQLRQAVEEHREKAVHHEKTVKEVVEASADFEEEVIILRSRLAYYESASAASRAVPLQPILQRLHQQRMGIAFARWWRRIFAKEHRRKQELRAERHFRAGLIRRSWRGIVDLWRRRAGLRRLLPSIQGSYWQRERRRCFKSWQDKALGTASLIATREAHKRLEGFLRSMAASLIFSALRRNHQLCKMSVLSKWWQGASKERQYEVILSRAARRMRRQIFRAFFNAWGRAAEFQKQRRARLRGVIQRTRKRLLGLGMGQWSRAAALVAAEEAERELLRMRMLRLLRRLANNQLLPAWAMWRDLVDFGRKSEIILRRAALRLSSRCLVKTLGTWREACASRRYQTQQ